MANEAKKKIPPDEQDGEDPGFLFHFATDDTVHDCMNTPLLGNIHLPLSRGKKIRLIFICIKTKFICINTT